MLVQIPKVVLEPSHHGISEYQSDLTPIFARISQARSRHILIWIFKVNVVSIAGLVRADITDDSAVL